MSGEWVAISLPKPGSKVEYVIDQLTTEGTYEDFGFWRKGFMTPADQVKRWRYVKKEKQSAWKKLDPDNLPKCPVLVRGPQQAEFIACHIRESNSRKPLFTAYMAATSAFFYVDEYCEIPE